MSQILRYGFRLPLALIFAHLARCAAAIFLRAAGDIVFFPGMVATLCILCGPLFHRAFAQRARRHYQNRVGIGMLRMHVPAVITAGNLYQDGACLLRRIPERSGTLLTPAMQHRLHSLRLVSIEVPLAGGAPTSVTPLNSF
jgi:hypothetical protein